MPHHSLKHKLHPRRHAPRHHHPRRVAARRSSCPLRGKRPLPTVRHHTWKTEDANREESTLSPWNINRHQIDGLRAKLITTHKLALRRNTAALCPVAPPSPLAESPLQNPRLFRNTATRKQPPTSKLPNPPSLPEPTPPGFLASAARHLARQEPDTRREPDDPHAPHSMATRRSNPSARTDLACGCERSPTPSRSFTPTKFGNGRKSDRVLRNTGTGPRIYPWTRVAS